MNSTAEALAMPVAKNEGGTSLGERISYALGDMGCNFVWTFTSGFLMLYFTDSVGVSSAFVGTMMMISRILDGASDIGMGILIEKTRSRLGKARPWLLIFSPLFALGMILLFRVPAAFTTEAKQIYIYASYIFMAVICYTAVNLAYNAMLPRFSLTPHDRNIVSSFRGIAVIITALFVSIGSPVLLERFGGQQEQRSWGTISVIYAALSLVMLLITFVGVKEKIPSVAVEDGEAERDSIWNSLRILLKIRYFYIAAALFVVFYAINGLGGVSIYYARDILGNANWYGLISAVMILPMLAGIPMMPFLYRKYGKRNVMLTGALISAAGCGLQLLAPGNLAMYLSFSIIRGFGSIMFSASIFTLAADIVEFSEWKYNLRTEGLVTSVNSFGLKVGTGIGAGMVGWILALGSYNSGSNFQPSSALRSMIALQVAIPMVLSILLAVLLAFWDIEKYRFEIKEYE